MDSALKHRLLGAAVLIALAIIFVPMFFSSSPPRQDNPTSNLSIPPAPERNFETRTLSVDASSKTPTGASKPTPASTDPNKVTAVDTAAPGSFEAPDKPAAAPADKPAAAAPTASTSAAATPAAPTPKPAAAPPAPPPPQADGRFVVNLGIYADAGGASALVSRVKKLGYPAFAEPTDYQGKAAQRVRVGPYPDRAAAEAVRLKIKQSEEKVASSVVDLGDRARETAAAEPADKDKGKADKGKVDKPAEPAPTPALAANRAGAYAVQAGAFKSEEEANKLRDRLRNGGLAAFAEKGKSGDQVLWKVRAGPFVDKGGAETARGALKQKFQIEGMIVTLP